MTTGRSSHDSYTMKPQHILLRTHACQIIWVLRHLKVPLPIHWKGKWSYVTKIYNENIVYNNNCSYVTEKVFLISIQPMLLRYVLHKRQGQLCGLHVFILSLNSINVGEILISHGNNFHNWAALYMTVSVPYRMVFFFSQ